MSQLLRVALPLIVLASISAPAWAGSITVFSSRVDWLAASGATESLDFNALLGSGSQWLGHEEAFGSIDFHVTPTSTDEGMHLVAADYAGDAAFYTSTYLLSQKNLNFGPAPIDRFIRFDDLFTTSFAADFGTFVGVANDLTFTFLFADGTTATEAVSAGGGAQTFIGFTSDTPFKQIEWESSNPFPTLDNVAYSTPVFVPEPATSLLMGGGIVAVAARIRRRRKAC
jgi:hypothetical protein